MCCFLVRLFVLARHVKLLLTHSGGTRFGQYPAITSSPPFHHNFFTYLCPEASHEYQHGRTCPATEPCPTSLVTHIDEDKHTTTPLSPTSLHRRLCFLLCSDTYAYYVLANHTRTISTTHTLPTNSSITALALSPAFRRNLTLLEVHILSYKPLTGAHTHCSVAFNGGGSVCVGPALDSGEDVYLDPTRRVYQTSDEGREGDTRTAGGGTRHMAVFHRLFPNVPAYPVDLVTTKTHRDQHPYQQVLGVFGKT